ncbi:helix-turn-helix transcriptional regulator [Archangium violaceum]|nr:helix-turn-helix transcriptional regulator [Archangium violaceum]
MGGAARQALCCRTVRPAAGLDDYLREPIGHYLAGENFLHWYASPELCGFTLWGRPGETQIQRLTQVLDVELAPALPHVSLVDTRRVEAPDANGLSVLVKYMVPRINGFSQTVKRQALLRPEGMTGAVVGGFYSLVSSGYPTRAFAEPLEALAWLGRPLDEAQSLMNELNDLVMQVMGQSPVLGELHRVLRNRLVGANLAEIARELGMSERTLQRRLREAGTSFQTELNTVQVRTAQSLLLGSDAKLTAVAVEVGCASLQHFSSLFRKMTGESPSSWRARHRNTL